MQLIMKLGLADGRVIKANAAPHKVCVPAFNDNGETYSIHYLLYRIIGDEAFYKPLHLTDEQFEYLLLTK